MANFIDSLMAQLQATPLIQGLQKTTPVQNIQGSFSGWAAKNPTQAGNILSTTGGSFGNMLAKPITAIQQSGAQAGQYVIKALSPVPVRAAVTPLANTVVAGGGKVASFADYLKGNKPIVAEPKPDKKNESAVGGTTDQQKKDAYDQMLAQQLKENTPYYQQLLESANWNINEAKKKLEEQYQLGMRKTKETYDAQTGELFKQTIPEEQLKMAENLNKRGLLATPTGKADQLTGKLSTGETISPTNPALTQKYGGIAGSQIGQMQSSQQARAEALGRALSTTEAGYQLPVTQQARQGEQDLAAAKTKTEMEKNVVSGQLAGDAYQRWLSRQEAGLKTAYS